MRNVHPFGSPYPVAPTPSTDRLATARRLEAAGDRWAPGLARYREQPGMSCGHLLGVRHGREPLMESDARDLAAALGVPVAWLKFGWK